MAANIQIEVGADIRQAVDGLKQFEKQSEHAFHAVAEDAKQASLTWKEFVGQRMGSYMKQFGGHGGAIRQIAKEWQDYKSKLGTVSPVQMQVAASAAKMATSAAAAGGSIAKTTTNFTGLSRILQDLPFGFQGIANNIQQVVPAAGALGLGISAVTSALVFAQVGFSSWTRGIGGAKEETDKAKKKIEETKEKVAELTKAFSDIKIDITAQVAGDTDGEIIKVQTLAKVVGDVTKSYSERNRALNELKEINKSYFGDITLESDKLNTLTSRVNEYTKALVASAVVKAFENKIGEVAVQLSEQSDKLKELRTQLNDIAGDYKLVGQNVKGFRLLTPEQNVQAEKLRSQIKEQEPLVSALANTYKKLQASIESAVLETLKFKPLGDEKTDTKKVKDNTKEIADALNERKRILTEFQKDFEVLKLPLPDLSLPLEKFSTEGLISELREKLNEALLRQPLKFTAPTELQAINPIKVPLPLKPTIVWQPTEFSKRFEAFNRDLESLVKNTQVTAAVAFGQLIADAFNGDGLDKAFKGIVGIMGGFLQELGKMLIKSAIIAQTFKKAFAALIANPAAALGVGVGLVALGGIIKNAVLPKPKPFAEGGLVFGPTFGLVGEGRGTTRNNPEVIAPLDKLQKMLGGAALRTSAQGQLVARVAGKDLLFILTQANSSQQRNMGRGSI